MNSLQDGAAPAPWSAPVENPLPGFSRLPGAAGDVDWGATALGLPSAWPDELRAAAGICLSSQFPLAIVWGPEFVYVYNDAAISVFGTKHPWAMGQRVIDVWPDAWPTLGPMLESVLRTGQAVRNDDLELMIDPHGQLVEAYLTFSYSPIVSARGTIGGVFIAFMETTERVLAERRQRTVSDLATAVARGRRSDDLLTRVREALDDNRRDLPFTALLRAGAGGRLGCLFATGHEAAQLPEAAAAILAGLAAPAIESGQPLLLDAARAVEALDVRGPWPEAPRQMLAMPFRPGGQDAPGGVLLVGVNPRRPLDAACRAFFDQVGGHVAHAVAVAEADVAERQRIAAMAELERSRSHFFAGASHELRTPLTLVLGPLGALLDEQGAPLAPGLREPLEMAHRNARRLNTLVSSLLDFARIEAGTLPLVLEPLDPSVATAEIAALFRAPVEAAGLRLTVASTLAPGPAMLDRDMWEKIVFNLLSNALKFTLQGGIAVRLGGDSGWIELEVADTGIGIEEEETARVFGRFYRSRGAEGQGAESGGVGLALVRELARLHGGDVALESRPGVGSRFTVRVPLHRPAPGGSMRQPPRPTAQVMRRAQFRDELARYGVHAEPPPLPPAAQAQAQATQGARVLVIERDEDVVRYVARLLQDSCAVASAPSANAALAAIRAAAPDLVLVDAMLPGAGGLDLVRRIRRDPAAGTVPLLVLSARADEEARLEALDAGADDFVAKPFSGRELSARVRSHVQMARVRRAAFEQETALRREIAGLRHDLATVLDGTRDIVLSLDRDLRVVALNDAAAAGRPKAGAVGLPLSELIPDIPGSPLERALRDAVCARDSSAVEYYDREARRWFEVRCYPAPHGALLFGTDITGRKLAEQAQREAHAELELRVAERTEALRAASGLLGAVFDRAPGGIALSDRNGRIVHANAAYAALVGLDVASVHERSLEDWVEPAGLVRLAAGRERLLAGEADSFEEEVRYRCPDGRRLWVAHFVSLIAPLWQGDRCFVTIARDVTARKRGEAESEIARQELRTLYERLQSVRENERKALAREVHDQLGQILSAAKIDIKLLEDDLRDDTRSMVRGAIIAELGSASATLERAIGLVREIATELRAPELDEHGLYAAITWHVHDFERRTRIACHVTFEPARPHPSRPASAALLRILQEAMTNVLRHAQASKVWVSLERRGHSLVLRVRDDGVGIPRALLRRGASLGLQGMRERAELVDGKLLAGPLAPRGTLVSVRVPLHSKREKGPRP